MKKLKNLLRGPRIIGGVIEQYCDKYPCNLRRKWLSKFILVGVDPDDPQLKKILSIENLKEVVDWRKVKAHLENLKGQNVTDAQKALPAYRIIGEVKVAKAITYAFKRGKVFSALELMGLRSTCHSIYDYIWDSNLLIRENQKTEGDRKLISQLKERVKKFNIGAENSIESDFGLFFSFFYNNYSDKFNTCSKYVRATNINYDYDKHWFFAYFQGFLLLKDLNYVYHCKSRAWVKNPFNASRGVNDYDFFELLKECNQFQLDEAFEHATAKLATLGHHMQDTYRYITYDMGIGGTHKKLYSWVSYPGKRLSCNKDIIKERRLSSFPSDIKWKGYKLDKKKDRTIILIETKKAEIEIPVKSSP